ncbi:MAG: hypothetical protein IJQ82_08420 [Selenomonadaceae bacterium]|nr:hypothetical protein [Selenomonadaceae bacterium]
MRALTEFLKPTQKELFKILRKMYAGKAFVCEGKFILVRGESPIMLLAHLDTVHSEPVKVICKSKDRNILMSPQGIGGDDRCGVYALVKTYAIADKKPWLLFTCDEEVGGLGANAFCLAHKHSKLPGELGNMKFHVEIDRRGSHDAVYYDCENLEFKKYITSKGFKTSFGSFSDISLVAPELGTAAVNLSSGYYNAHTQYEYIVRSELENTIAKVCEMVADVAKDSFPKYAYVKKVHTAIKWYDWYPNIYRDKERVYGSNANLLTRCSDIEDIDEEPVRKKLPSEYEQLYDELLELYTLEELELYREEYGDEILYRLYADEYGTFYAAQER